MFGIPGKQAVTITPKAAAQIRKLMDQAGHAGLRIGVKKGGCAGMEYTMEYVDAADPNDEVVEQDGARVMIAPMAQMFLAAGGGLQVQQPQCRGCLRLRRIDQLQGYLRRSLTARCRTA